MAGRRRSDHVFVLISPGTYQNQGIQAGCLRQDKRHTRYVCQPYHSGVPFGRIASRDHLITHQKVPRKYFAGEGFSPAVRELSVSLYDFLLPLLSLPRSAHLVEKRYISF